MTLERSFWYGFFNRVQWSYQLSCSWLSKSFSMRLQFCLLQLSACLLAIASVFVLNRIISHVNEVPAIDLFFKHFFSSKIFSFCSSSTRAIPKRFYLLLPPLFFVVLYAILFFWKSASIVENCAQNVRNVWTSLAKKKLPWTLHIFWLMLLVVSKTYQMVSFCPWTQTQMEKFYKLYRYFNTLHIILSGLGAQRFVVGMSVYGQNFFSCLVFSFWRLLLALCCSSRFHLVVGK